MGKARKRRTKLIAQLRKEHPDWDSSRIWNKANDMDQREQAALQGRRWRAAEESRMG